VTGSVPDSANLTDGVWLLAAGTWYACYNAIYSAAAFVAAAPPTFTRYATVTSISVPRSRGFILRAVLRCPVFLTTFIAELLREKLFRAMGYSLFLT
jgi:hypothetical protein